jgi:predicted ester cyclase
VVARIFEEFFNARDEGAADRLVSPDYACPAGRGPEGFRALARHLQHGFPDLHFTMEDMVEEGTRVAIRWRSQGTHLGPFAGVAPTGRVVKNEGVGIYRLRAGKIVEFFSQVDRLGVLQQIGAVPAFAGPVPSSLPAD